MTDLFIWAHRGASSEAPENTLAAFALAEAQGADGIELDLQLSRDGVPMVLHDETLDRTSNGRGRLSRFSCRELQQLDCGSWFGPGFAGERLPRLGEVLDWAGDRLRLNLEIKDAAVARALLELLQNYPQSRVLISSFDHRLLADLRQADAGLALGFLCDSRLWRRSLQRALKAKAASFHPRVDLVSRAMLQHCRQANLPVFPWTVDAPASARRLRRLGIAGLFTNRPGALRSELRLD